MDFTYHSCKERRLRNEQAKRSYMLYSIFSLGLVVLTIKLLLLILLGVWNLTIIIPIIAVMGCWVLIKSK